MSYDGFFGIVWPVAKVEGFRRVDSTVTGLTTVNGRTDLVKDKVARVAVLIGEQLVNALAQFDMADLALEGRPLINSSRSGRNSSPSLLLPMY
ncbi:hypothetical protein [Endozoicomonas sp. ONNA2]|uniref:hypothetical protein n=1 Tax=Endozoicomonas sp. ONNA2 TaxID=2828741 RepID=UPI002147C6B8|nr:hypothetical protein [Endozoicomonas sp. ONNA2]